MTSETYKARSGATQLRPVLTEAEFRHARNEDQGFCLNCGVEAFNVEPDARQLVCEGCGAAKVYGIEELLMRGIARIQ